MLARDLQDREAQRALAEHVYVVRQLPRDVRGRVHVVVWSTTDGKLMATFYTSFKKPIGSRIIECTLDGYRIPDEVIAHLCVVV
jgi:hypothetical protein